MNNINDPSKICQEVEDGLKTKIDALEILETIISEDESESKRIDAIKSIGKLSIKNDKVFKILEKTLVSDESPIVRIESAKIILSHFNDRDMSPILWSIENEDSIFFFKHLLDFIESDLESKFDTIKVLTLEKLKKIYGLAYPDMKFIIDLDYLEARKLLNQFQEFYDKFSMRKDLRRDFYVQNTKINNKGLSRINKKENDHIVSMHIYEMDEIPLSVNHLPSLMTLKIDHCNFSKKNLEDLDLGDLESLSFINNQLNHLPEWVWKIASNRRNTKKFINDGVNASQARVLALLEILIDMSIKPINKFEDFFFSHASYYKSNEMGQITGVYIVNIDNKMGILPDQICNLKHLEELYLINQNLNSIPNCLMHLTKLRILNLSNNPINSIPNNVELAHNLEIIDLHVNEKETTEFIVPSNINDLKNLRKLDLRGKNVKKIPNEIKNRDFININ